MNNKEVNKIVKEIDWRTKNKYQLTIQKLNRLIINSSFVTEKEQEQKMNSEKNKEFRLKLINQINELLKNENEINEFKS